MSITPVHLQSASRKTKELFTAIENRYGFIPNTMKAMAHAPAVLQGHLAAIDHLAAGSLEPRLAELIALTVANMHNSRYCDVAHSFIASRLVGLDDSTIRLARQGKSGDERIQAMLIFVQSIVAKRGRVTAHDMAQVRQQGYSDADMVEIIACTALNIFTNYFNNIANPPLDFPVLDVITPGNGLSFYQ